MLKGMGDDPGCKCFEGGKGWTIGLSDAAFDLGGREMSVSGEEGNGFAHFTLEGRTCPGPCPSATPAGQCWNGFSREESRGEGGRCH